MVTSGVGQELELGGKDVFVSCVQMVSKLSCLDIVSDFVVKIYDKQGNNE